MYRNSALLVRWTLAIVGLLAAGMGYAATPYHDAAAGWDHLFHEVIIDLMVLGISFGLVTAYLILKYRRTPDNPVGTARPLSTQAALGWALIPAFIFMADDFFIAANGWQLWNSYRTVPAERLEVKLESGMYSWDYTYANGIHTQNELIVPAGKPVMLRMTSRDTIHGHFIPDFRVKEDSMPGRTTFLWFLPKQAGKEHLVTCSMYCGVMHSMMPGKIIVKTPEEFQAWYEQNAPAAKAAKAAEPDKAGDKAA
jgi:cytochrome c oxidase subunit 2